MTRTADRHPADSAKWVQIASYAAIVAAVWLGWEVIKVPVIDRAGPEIAVRLSPTSPEVLRQAAEAEFAAKRYDNARALAEESLSRAPFNTRALRVRGLVEAEGRNRARANELLTLAGNWSLRDDPAHAWLMEDRLRSGDYGSSFAHADTLVRRRLDLYPQIFSFFTLAAVSDPRSLPALIRLLADSPPWRGDYLNSLHEREDGASVLAVLAIGLQKSEHPFTDSELGHLYRTWASRGQFPGIRYLRAELGRPDPRQPLQNGDFSDEANPDTFPFQWHLATAPGLAVLITEDDLGRGGGALRVQYDGRKQGVLAEQLLTLSPGDRTLSGQTRVETPSEEPQMRWTVRCVDTDTVIATAPAGGPSGGDMAWVGWSVAVPVPTSACTAQWLRLESIPGQGPAQTVLWFDDIMIR